MSNKAINAALQPAVPVGLGVCPSCWTNCYEQEIKPPDNFQFFCQFCSCAFCVIFLSILFLCSLSYLRFRVRWWKGRWPTVTNNLPPFIQAADSNVFIAGVMTPLYYWPFLLIHHIDVKALFNILKRHWPIDCVAVVLHVHLTCEQKKPQPYPACYQFVWGIRGCMKICCPLKSMEANLMGSYIIYAFVRSVPCRRSVRKCSSRTRGSLPIIIHKPF